MTTLGFGDDRLDVEFNPFASVGLVEGDLEFATNVVVLHLGELVAGDEHINLLRLIVADRYRAAGLCS